MYIYIYPDALRANPPPRFFKEVANIWRGGSGGGGAPPRDIGRTIWHLRVQSTVLGVLRGPLEVLWGSWGSCGGPEGSGGVLGRAGGVPGRIRGDPGGGLKIVIFSFFRGEFVNGLMKYWCFQFWVILWGGRWSLRYATFLSFLEACFLRNSEVNML
jgi:hypothetical protein